MRRLLLAAGVALFAFSGAAQAKPWLTMHRAKTITYNIADDDIALGGITRYRITYCKRVTRTYVWCEVHEWGNIIQPGMPEGQGMYYVDMHLLHGGVHAITPLGSDWY